MSTLVDSNPRYSITPLPHNYLIHCLLFSTLLSDQGLNTPPRDYVIDVQRTYNLFMKASSIIATDMSIKHNHTYFNK